VGRTMDAESKFIKSAKQNSFVPSIFQVDNLDAHHCIIYPLSWPVSFRFEFSIKRVSWLSLLQLRSKFASLLDCLPKGRVVQVVSDERLPC